MKNILKRTYCIMMDVFLFKINDTHNLIILLPLLLFKQINYICNKYYINPRQPKPKIEYRLKMWRGSL